ncbi:transmembrane protein [Mycobacterium bohemicum DSM 44277]|uniref:Transmembrane protein n=1 Tax=Mycobacterium bohemicum DSM 44277 TaxID=1236609 RepID=A0A0U0W9J2_MYCBE|nr:AI-2E family transporter [Mycobacterium bohemicum]CPR11273.1 transmembrane protein [Mycobacterium bohemicum DSM 44277]
MDDKSDRQPGGQEPADPKPRRRAHRDNEGAIAAAERAAAQMRSESAPFGARGERFNRRSPFFVGMAASAGVAVTYAAVRVLGAAAPVLVLVGAAMFFALGLEPAVAGLVKHKVPRWAAVTLVVVVVFGVFAGAVAAAIPPLAQEARQFIEQVPRFLQEAQNHSTVIGGLNERFHVQQRITDMLHTSGAPAVGGLLRAGETVFGALSHVGIVAVLTVYFLGDMPRIRATMYRLVPKSRRPRAILIGDEVMAKVGDYVFGNVLTSLIAGAATFAWCFFLHVPYAVLLGVFVAIIDLFPYGSTVGGFVVALVALTVSIPVSIATVAFYVGFRLAEDYLLTPRIIGRAVRVPGGVTVFAVLIGAALLGVVGALVAIPVAAAVQLLVSELLFPTLDEA